MGERLAWDPGTGGFGPVDEPLVSPVVVDSWLLADGRVRGLGRHRSRFRRACELVGGVPPEVTDRFFARAVAELPRSGLWFPRVELVPPGASFRLWIRPCPDLRPSVVMWVPGEPDMRARPTVKGPDLDYLGALRERARKEGADEALLVSLAGHVLEGTTTSLLWWRGDELRAPAATRLTLPGVTGELIGGLASSLGRPIRRERAPLRDLDGLEVWAVNALHGIRPVTAWLGTALRTYTAPGRCDTWRRYLAETGRLI